MGGALNELASVRLASGVPVVTLVTFAGLDELASILTSCSKAGSPSAMDGHPSQ